MKTSPFYKNINEKIQCTLCERRCKLSNGEQGICRVRFNKNGKLYTLTYGRLSAMESRPIEIKPFYHYWPGSTSLTIATYSCNFSCPWCQNYQLSRNLPLGVPYTPPEAVIERTLKNLDNGLCLSFQEPTLLTEYAIDLFKLGREYGLYGCYVSNGYMTKEALYALIEAGLTGLNIDIKGGEATYKRYCDGIDVYKIWRNIKIALDSGVHVEVVNLVVTGVNEDDVDWIIENHLKFAGEDTPLHFTRYYPRYKFTNPATSIEILEKFVEKAKREGVKYVYIGNVPGHKYENTYCPGCGRLLIRRFSYRILDYGIEDSKCPWCKEKIRIYGSYIPKDSI
ncbi:MAG TPA: radical SAM protein [Methanothermobacter sp.]|jgi:pyruvate formate lyase activating enzyme|uniref:AmmeMemoRadiSam system radical SAM enzyme n=1 Tax=Methanothermobacter tenebrarum TaxID=680118 RepID=A0ABN6PBM3_9EURY|nr:radical SAM protein [Methanothermobacter tenebrarum]MDI6881373.1 radical SAM protein [Methanothermobacter sp.]MDX9693293.1 radical SAM protein [Methanothermobacter sp.]BDH79647.1 AmmeMemoRadiSam system radical SAM enzyme [Methanothermobacter tenebrarum]HHW16292.1 radical SAM protein [Methanothermobacter sp.]